MHNLVNKCSGFRLRNKTNVKTDFFTNFIRFLSFVLYLCGAQLIYAKTLKKYKLFITTMVVLSAIIIISFYNILTPTKVLPIYQPAQVNFELVDSTIQHKKKYHKIADFKLVNQNGDTITQTFYKDKIYVADFFFTTCQTICPIMTDHMYEIQKQTISDPEVLLLSHTVTPEIDSVAQLKAMPKRNW